MKNPIYVDGFVSPTSGIEICKNIQEAAKNSSDDISIFINSSGGDLQSIFAIIDCINTIPNKVTTICLGKCSSAAVFLFLSCSERLISENSVMIIHEPFLPIHENTFFRLNDLINEYQKLSFYNKKISEMFTKKTGITKEKLANFYSQGDVFLSSEDCINYGIATETLDSIV